MLLQLLQESLQSDGHGPDPVPPPRARAQALQQEQAPAVRPQRAACHAEDLRQDGQKVRLQDALLLSLIPTRILSQCPAQYTAACTISSRAATWDGMQRQQQWRCKTLEVFPLPLVPCGSSTARWHHPAINRQRVTCGRRPSTQGGQMEAKGHGGCWVSEAHKGTHHSRGLIGTDTREGGSAALN